MNWSEVPSNKNTKQFLLLQQQIISSSKIILWQILYLLEKCQ